VSARRGAIAGHLARRASAVVALAAIAAAYAAARLPSLDESQRAALAERFRFATSPLPDLPGRAPAGIRAVHPALAKHAAWISTVGAAVALADVDGDGLPNDCCHVDPRFDAVIVAPVPGTGSRFAPFTLDAGPLTAARTIAPMGCLGADLNVDGWTDLLVTYWGRPPIAFLRRGGAGAPAPEAFAAVEVAPGEERWFTNAVTTADLDGDGHLDLVVGNYFPDGARILDPEAHDDAVMQDSMSRAFNGGSDRLLLWRSAAAGAEPTVAFTDASAALEARVARGWTLAVGAADLDGDLLPELYFANDFGPDRLLHNRSQPGVLRFAVLEGRRGPTTAASKVLGRDSFKGMGVDFGDVDGDGHLDISVSNIAKEFALEESHFLFVSTGETGRMADGVAPFVDRSERLGLSRSGWGWDVKLADFDNDGALEAIQATGFLRGRVNRWPELHELAMGNDSLLQFASAWPQFAEGDDLSGHEHNPFFVRGPGGRFFDVAHAVGLGDEHVSRGIAIGDVDGDGDLDLALANQWEPSSFLRNDAPAPGAFLGLNLLLPVEGDDPTPLAVRPGFPAAGRAGFRGRPAIGASAAVIDPTGRRLVAQVDGGNGHSGKRSPQIHFGLGDTSPGALLDVALRWRDARGAVRETALRLAPGWHTVLLGEAAASPPSGVAAR
jgi:hypothetical protein